MADLEIAPWLPQDDFLVPFYKGISDFVSNQLCYTNSDDDKYKLLGEKSIVDPVLGYIHLNSWEVALLDTKLFQRLRGIRQLGLAYQVFPTLGYSRFEHTIGVVGRLAQTLNKLIENHRRIKPKDQTIPSTIAEFEIPIRLAALFHDVGHCLFSHVSERVVSELQGTSKYPSAKKIQERFSEHFERQKAISLGEILSIVILGSEKTVSFLNKLQAPEKTMQLVNDWQEQAARFILGLPIQEQPKTLFLAQLMSSGLDVDKLDYMAREAHFSGIKLELDLDRILDKLQVFELTSSALPQGLSFYRRFLTAGKEFSVLGLAKGGQFAFEEFCIARVALYDKIYLHQKIRAAEAQLTEYLKRIPRSYSEFSEVHRWLYLMEAFISYPGANVPTLPDSGPLFSTTRTFSTIGFDNIEYRALLHRAFAFGPSNSLSDPPTNILVADQNIIENLPSVRLIQDVNLNPVGFKQEVIDEVKKIADLLGYEYSKELENELVVDIPRYSIVQQGHDSIYFEKPSRLPVRWTMPIDRIVDYYLQNRALAFLFSHRGDCPIILLATEKVIWHRSRSIFVQEGTVSTKVFEESEKMRKKLSDKGYYASAPSLKPISKYLKSAEAQDMIQKVCLGLSQFESYNRQRVTVAHLTNFLTQFREDIQEIALQFLEHIKIIDQTVLATIIRDTFNTSQLSGVEKIALVPLGGNLDSAVHLMYPLREISSEAGTRSVPEFGMINDNLVLKAEHIVFFDDNINSGLQVLNIFAGWLGIDLPTKMDLKEEHVQAIGDKAKEKLLKMPLTLVFGVATEGAEDRVKNLLSSQLNFNSANLSVKIYYQLNNSEKIFSGHNSKFNIKKKNELRDFLRNAGFQLLINEGKTEEVALERALGYGGAEAMVVFPYNVPTMTITSLWCSGMVDGQEWIPLVERRRRKKMDGTLAGEDA